MGAQSLSLGGAPVGLLGRCCKALRGRARGHWEDGDHEGLGEGRKEAFGDLYLYKYL